MHPLWLSDGNISWTVSSHWTCFWGVYLEPLPCGKDLLWLQRSQHVLDTSQGRYLGFAPTRPPTLLRSSFIFWVLWKSGWNPSSIIPSILVDLCVYVVSRAFDTIVRLLSESLTLLSIWALITALNPPCFPAKLDGTLRRVFGLLWHLIWSSNCFFSSSLFESSLSTAIYGIKLCFLDHALAFNLGIL